MDTIKTLEKLFHPESIAIVGASGDKNKLGYELVRGFVEMGYSGKLYLVNAFNTDKVFDLPVYRKIEDITDEIVLAVISTPPTTLPGLLRECVKKKVKGIILFVTPADQHQPELIEAIDLVKSAGIRMVGPNSMGIHCPASGMALWPELPGKTGSVSIISHSGAMAFCLISGVDAMGIGCAKAISVGNEWDLVWTDYLEYFGTDDDTDIIVGYIEGVQDGRRLLSAARSVGTKKPILCMKGGDSETGGVFTGSHTGAMAGSREIWKAAFDQSGIVKTLDFQDTLHHVVMFKQLMLKPLGSRIGLISGTGGPTVIAVDLCEQYGLEIPELSPPTKQSLTELLPPYGSSCRNPVDLSIAAGVNPSLYTRGIQILDQSPDIDVILCVHAGDYALEAVTERLVDEYPMIAKPLVVIFTGATEKTARCIRLLQGAGIPAYDSQRSAVRALSAVIKWKESQN